MLNAIPCVYRDSYILAEGKITVVGEGADGSNKEVFLKHCAPFIKCINKINNAKVVEDLDIVIPINSLLECSENRAKNQLVYGNVVKMNQIIKKQILNRLNLNQV